VESAPGTSSSLSDDPIGGQAESGTPRTQTRLEELGEEEAS